MNTPLVPAVQLVYVKNSGDVENMNATKNEKRSSFFLSFEPHHTHNHPKIYKFSPNIKIIYSIDKSVLIDVPDNKKGYILLYDSGYTPNNDSG